MLLQPAIRDLDTHTGNDDILGSRTAHCCRQASPYIRQVLPHDVKPGRDDLDFNKSFFHEKTCPLSRFEW